MKTWINLSSVKKPWVFLALCISAMPLIGAEITVPHSGNASTTQVSISNEYREIAMALCSELELALSTSRTNAAPIIKTIGNLRCIEAKPILLNILGYPARHQSKDLFTITDSEYKYFHGVFSYVGEYRMKEGQFPAFGAIERIGVTFSEVTNALVRYPFSHSRNEVFGVLGRQSSGYYFEKYLYSLIESGDHSQELLLDEM